MIRKVLKLLIRISLIAGTAYGSGMAAARAEKMSIANHTLVIEKLERVLSTVEPDDNSQTALKLRLADLYSERARLYFMEDMAKSGTEGPQIKKDRKRAVDLYSAVFERVPQESKGKVLLQMAHLHELNGDTPKAVALYKKVIQAGTKSYTADLVGQSHGGLGDIYFRKMDSKKASEHFKKALEIPVTPRRGYITYRLAWCLFNMSRLAEARDTLIRLLRSPELLAQQKPLDAEKDTVEVSNSFHEEASRDLATFFARGTVGTREIQLMIELSPENVQTSNLLYLANELDRVGKKKQAVQVWAVVNAQQEKPKDQLEGHIRLAQLNYDLEKYSEALTELGKAVQLWKAEGCKDEEHCGMLKARFRKLVTDWDRTIKEKPSANLFTAYSLYVSLFSDDAEMHYWGANVARRAGELKSAALFYRQASLLAGEILAGSDRPKSPKAVTELKNVFEGSLLSQIEVAEESKDAQLRNEAYDHYLKLNPNGEKATEVRYQKAHILYEKGQYNESAEAFWDLATSKDCRGSLCEKAADLGLDSLALMKDETRLEKWALQLASRYPSKKKEFTGIARKAAMNRVASTLNQPQASESELEGALLKMKAVPLDGASDKEKIAFYKNKIIVAERLKDLPEVKAAANQLLALPRLSEEDREYALSRRVWAAELQLDFATAFALSKKMSMSKLSRSQKQLRLGILAELAGKNPESYYVSFLKSGGDPASRQMVISRLVRRARNPHSVFQKYSRELFRNPSLYTRLALEVFAQTKDLKFAKSVTKTRTARSTPSGTILQRFVFMNEFKKFKNKISSHRIVGTSPALLKKTMKQRLNLLAEADRWGQNAIRSQDWTLQIMTLTAIAQENARTYKNIISLPAPRGLNAVQKRQYRELLLQQGNPYYAKMEQVERKLAEFWNDTQMLHRFLDEMRETKGALRRLQMDEVRTLSRIAPSSKSKYFVSAQMQPENKPSQQAITRARSLVAQNPFDLQQLENLKEIETQAGRDTMVAFLNQRIEQMKTGND